MRSQEWFPIKNSIAGMKFEIVTHFQNNVSACVDLVRLRFLIGIQCYPLMHDLDFVLLKTDETSNVLIFLCSIDQTLNHHNKLNFHASNLIKKQ